MDSYLITARQAAAIVGMSRQRWYVLEGSGRLPEPAQHYPCRLWDEAEVRAYAQARAARQAEDRARREAKEGGKA